MQAHNMFVKVIRHVGDDVCSLQGRMKPNYSFILPRYCHTTCYAMSIGTTLALDLEFRAALFNKNIFRLAVAWRVYR